MTGNVSAKHGRNDPCPCGSGKKYKHCCMQGKAVADVARQVQLALGYHRSGKMQEAEKAYHEALKLDPNNVDAMHLLGVLSSHTGRHDAAAEWIGKAIAISPSVPALYLNLGNVYQAQGKLDQAIESFSRALELKPDFAEAHLNLGNAYQTRRNYTAAIAHYEKALALKPEHPDALLSLGNVLQAEHRWNEAVDCYSRSLTRRPDSPEAHYNLGNVLNKLGHFKDAASCFQRALELNPDLVEAQMNLGGVFMAQGRLEEAVGHYEQAVQMNRAYALARSNALLATQYASHLSPEEIFARHRAFGIDFEGAMPHFPLHPNTRKPKRKIKIGYVSPDFRQHSVAYFAETVLARHNHTLFEVYGYYNHHIEDGITERFKGYCDHWLNINQMGDADVAQRIRDDGIDILVDLAGHTGQNRLPVFALKPAPVQVTWLGHPNTTGLKSMDYRITDSYAEPVGMTELLNTETLWRMPDVFCCYTPCAANPERRSDAALAVQPTPMLRNGYVTFGCFNNIAKVSPQTVALWSRLMKSVPGSRLMLEAWWLDSPELQEQIYARFAMHGIEAERLVMKPRTPEQQYVLYHEVDVALDPFPCSGGTTTFDGLWMGVPLVTLAGRTFVSRMGVSLLSNMGLSDLAAASEDAYVEKAQRLIADPEALNALRLGMREKMERSPLMDAPLFVKNMEKAYRAMWKKWCEDEPEV